MESAALRDWLDGLPGQAFFFTDEIPDWTSSLRSTLSRISADGDHPVVRVAHGFYCKRWHQDWPPEDRIDAVNVGLGSLHFGGTGAGAANWNALNLVGWTAQHPVRKDVCCLGRPPRSPWPHTRFVERLNERRADLTWAEVALLEALRLFDYSNIDWDEAVGVIASGDYLCRLRYDAEVDRDRLRWAAEGERRQPHAFHARVAELCASIPEFDSLAAWRHRSNRSFTSTGSCAPCTRSAGGCRRTACSRTALLSGRSAAARP
ncbi:hypothetical protein [Candidatus Poriferisodalis sp.]|uniref:hypothetical protein n=1 Tax=Candidatus Poriferisodalis sp. TaxID=3101277 RepID=UPI003B02D440